jgi:ubiquinone/menaquinone biosynthesis C-methylase UbiE
MCRSGLWRRHVERELLPWVLTGIDLGDDVLEIGPGPGVTTDVLAARSPRLTALEIDTRLAKALRERTAGSTVEVVEGDGTAMPFPDGRFSAVVSCTMLHHVSSPELQDRLLAEASRVIRPGGVFAGCDSIGSMLFSLAHLGDTMVLVEPGRFRPRLERAGFADIEIERGRRAFRFRARRPVL